LGREYKRGNTTPGSSEVGSIEVMPQVPKEMWPENHRNLYGLMLEVQGKLEPSYLKKKFLNENICRDYGF
jgi:hypothetical protein